MIFIVQYSPKCATEWYLVRAESKEDAKKTTQKGLGLTDRQAHYKLDAWEPDFEEMESPDMYYICEMNY